MPLKIYYMTFGCKVNQYETDKIAARFAADGHLRAADIADADVCVINSCTVTAEADKKLRQFISRVKRESPRCMTVLTGCYPTAFRDKAEELGCTIYVQNKDKQKIPQIVCEHTDTSRFAACTAPAENQTAADSRTRAYIKIQDGCNLFCTYCIIPYARGRLRSKPLDDIEKEVRQLAAEGYREIILTGINLCCYGKDLGGRRLVDAIETVCSVEGDFRVRLSSMEPEMISDEDIARMAAQPKLCPHFHLSLQSGCDRTLRAMNRHYDSAQYLALCEKLRKVFPDCAITTDIMAGFPDETEEDFAESLAFAEKVGFAGAHIFPYSRRSGTKADLMPNQLDNGEKAKRAAKMSEVCKGTALRYNSRFIGRTVEVLFEREGGKPYHTGHSREYIEVRVPREGGETWRRQVKRIRITEAEAGFCIGEETDT